MGLAGNEMDMNYLLNQYLLKRLESNRILWTGGTARFNSTPDRR